jgi:hypothetical protein
MSDPPCPSLYRVLDSSKEIKEIRLLTSFVIDAEDRVTCCLATVPLDKTTPPYTALSYVWGKRTDRISIQVDGQDFPATTSLAHALHCIPHHWKAKYPSRKLSELRVWADAICINQNSPKEKAEQVQLMGNIYSGAELVMCWMPDGIWQPGNPQPFSDDIQDVLLSVAFGTLEVINRELRLVEQKAGCTLWELPPSDERLVCWLKEHLELSQTVSHNVFPFWRNRIWEAVGHFFDLQYWKRVWIFQEVVLAQKALLFCKTSCISMTDTIDYVLSWLRLLESWNAPAPQFISPSLWESLISGRGLFRGNVYGHLGAWNQRREERFALPWRSFYSAALLAASNPKDHVYGMLGATGIGVPVDYSEQTSVAEVCRNVASAWLQDKDSDKEVIPAKTTVPTKKELEELEELKERVAMKELWFLNFAGLRRNCDHVICQYFSSWAPNFPHVQHKFSDFMFSKNVNADNGVFSNDKSSKMIYIQGSSLFVTGLGIGSVRQTYPHVNKTSGIFGLLLALVLDKNGSGHPELWTGRRLLRDLFELLCWNFLPDSILNAQLDVSDHDLFEYLAYSYAFVWAVLSGGDEYRTAIKVFGLGSDTEKNFLHSLRKTFLYSKKGYKKYCKNKTGPGFDSHSSSWLEDLVGSEAKRQIPKEGRLGAYCRQITIYLETGCLDTSTLFRTSHGHFGLACRNSTVCGDYLCVLKGHDSVASLRKDGDHFIYVGDTRVQGMMKGQAVKLLKEGGGKGATV